MIERKANELIHDFFKNDKRALLVTGARQVGKTFAIRKIGKECFDQVVEINFIEQPDAIALFSEPKDAADSWQDTDFFRRGAGVQGDCYRHQVLGG